MFIGKETIKNALNYIKELEKENKNLKDTDLSCVYLKGVYDGKEQATADSTPNSVIREKKEEIQKIVSSLKDEYGIHQNDYLKRKLDSITEILKEGEK